MRIPRRLVLPSLAAATVLLAAACSDNTLPTDAASSAPASRPSLSMSDAANGGRAGVYWLAPLVPSPTSYSDTFDPGVSVSARVCTPVPACGTTVASWSTGGSGSSAISVDVARQWYAATWAAPASLTLGANTYRLELYGPGSTERLAYIDYYVVNSATELRNTPAGYAGLVRGSNNAIRFRIETGAPFTVTVSPPSASVNVGGTQVFTATVTNLHGNPIPTSAIQWSSSNTGVATVSPTSGSSSTTATGVAGGTANIVATFAGASGQGVLTVNATTAPTAVADAYPANAGSTINVPAGTGLLANDNLGTPAATVAFYGGGSLGGAVTDHAAETTTTFGTGGSLTVHADGSFSYTPATGFAGDFTFTYRITNSAGSSDATVTISVQRAPTAVNDTYNDPLSGSLTVAAPGVMANDDRGVPQANVASFGGGDLGGTVTSNAAGASVSDGHGGTIELDADGKLTHTPSGTFHGSITFSYRLTSTFGSSDATVTIQVPQAPSAVNDSYSAPAGTLTLSAPGVLSNDALGSPAGTVTKFGGGSLGGTVDDNIAGATKTFGSGGSLQVNADGSLSFTRSSGFTGDFTFEYRLANAFGSSVATVTITVPKAPDAVDDAPASNSVPGDKYHTALNTALTIPSGNSPSILANDDRGAPQADVVSFGAGTLGGTVNDHAAGTSASNSSGTISIATDGTVTFTPASGFTGLFTVQYKLQNVAGSDVATLTIAVGARPSASDDTYGATLVGNVPVNTDKSTGFSVLSNDGGDQRVASLTGSPTGGTVVLDADGTFKFTPNPGFNGTASFQYLTSNGFGSSAPATVNIPVGTKAIWFVDANAATNGDGRFETPFKTLAAAAAINDGASGHPDGDDTFFLYESGTDYVGPITLRDGQRAVGQDANSSLATHAGVTLPADSPDMPAMAPANATVSRITSAGNDVVLGQNNHLRGLTLGNAGTSALKGTSFGTLATSDVKINTTGQAIELATGTIDGDFAQVKSTGGANNVALNSVATNGTTDLGTSADELSGATGDALSISGENGSFTYAGPISNTNTLAARIANKSGGSVVVSGSINPTAAGRGILVTGNSSGATTITFSGAAKKISVGSTARGVDLTSNSGATITFSNGGLAVSTDDGDAFRASGGGTVQVTGAGNTLASTGGIALNVQSTSIGASGLTFQKIDAAGGTNGILLSSTGTTGGLEVTGDGASDPANTTRGRTTAKSGGGSLTLGSGGTLSGTTSHAVSLSNAGAVTLRNIVVDGGGGDGIMASTVSSLTIDNDSVTAKATGHGLHGTQLGALTIRHTDIGNNATDASTAAADIWNVRLDNLAGTANVSSSKFHHGYEHIFVVKNTSAAGTFNATNSNFTDAGHGDGLDTYAYGSSSLTVSVTGDSLARNSAFGFDSGTENAQSGTLNVTVSGNQVINNFVGIDVAHGSSGTNTFSITGNNVQANVSLSSQAINVNRLGNPSFSGFGLFSGTVNGNTIGTDGVANSGSKSGDGITVSTNGNGGETRVTITNNTIRNYGQHGIGISAGDVGSGSHTLQARVQGNNIAQGKAVTSLDGVNVTMGALNTDHLTMCLDIGGTTAAVQNTVTAAVRNGIRVRSSGLPAAVITLTMPGWDGTGAAYLAARNPAATGLIANTSFGNGNGTTTAGSCTTP